MTGLRALRSFIFDLDGCIWYGGEPAPGAIELVRYLRGEGKGVFFLTNVSGYAAAELAERLGRAGIEADPASVIGPLSLIGRHPALRGCPPTLVLGTDSVREALRTAGVPLTVRPEEARTVVVGRDPEMTYSDLAAAVRAIDGGAPLLALNLDLRVPAENGVMVPGCGAIVAALTAATGAPVSVVGKPSDFFFREALEAFGARARETAMIGDSLDSDIAGGRAAGLVTVLVGDGVGGERTRVTPDVRVADLPELLALLRAG
jgi:HAD superfamily hydrolase (TIGR01450 family)